MSSAPSPSPEQRAIRLRGARSSVLIAAAGSGKTRVLTWLYADAIREHGDRVEQLLAITFTEKAAGELRQRIAAELGDAELDRAWIGTFHATCTRLLREFAHHRGLDPAFGVLDDLEAHELRLAAWEQAVADLLQAHGEPAHELLAQLGELPLRSGLIGWWEARRSDGELHPVLPVRETTAADVRRSAAALASEATALSGEIAARQAGRSAPLASLTTRAELCDELATLATECERLAEQQTGGSSPRIAAIAARVERAKVAANQPLSKLIVEPLEQARLRLALTVREHLAGPHVQLLAELADRFSRAYDEAKRSRDRLDFDDLELQALALLRESPEVAARLTERFTRIFVDEFQDTNPRQAELVDRLAGGRPWSAGGDGRPAVTVVGDPRQAIYGFRFADVTLIGSAAAQAPPGGELRLSTNYRTRPAILREIDGAFARLDAGHEPVQAGRAAADEEGPQVELLITYEHPDDSWELAALGSGAGGVTGTKLAEARLLAARIRELRAAEPARSIAVLARARAVLAPIAGALADLGVDAQIDGADGFWQRLEVSDLVHWLRLVRSRADDAALVAVCASPLVGLSTDGLALLGELRAAGDGEDREARLLALARSGELLTPDDRARVEAMIELLRRQRSAGRDHDPAQLLDEVIAATAYDEHLLLLQDGRRAIANVMRLRRLAAEQAAAGGRLADVVQRAQREVELELRATEAAVSGPGAVRLMTVHQAKGLEFGTVIVAGLGRQPRFGGPTIIGDSSRLGLRLRTGPGQPLSSLFDFEDLKAEREEREAAELRRVLYVALTRAEDRLIVSGALRASAKGSGLKAEQSGRRPVLTWLAPNLVPALDDDLLARASDGPIDVDGVRVQVSSPAAATLAEADRSPRGGRLAVHRAPGPHALEAAPARPLPPPATISYTALSAHARCALRFHAERAVGLRTASLPPVGGARGARAGSGGGPAIGSATHAALEHLAPGASPALVASAVEAVTTGLDDDGVRWTPSRRAEVQGLVEAGLASPAVAGAHALPQTMVERPFLVALGGGRHLLTGVLDLYGLDPATGRAIVVDYKTDRFPDDAPLEAQITDKYALQRSAYALAALEAGAERVEVVHVALRREHDASAVVAFARADAPGLRAQLNAEAARLADPPRATETPSRWVCDGCPARGGLCGYGLSETDAERPSGQQTLWGTGPASA